MGKPVEAVIFDLDGVITDTAHYHYIAWKELAHELNISFDEAFNEQLKGIGRMESLEKILIHGNKQNDFTADEKIQLAGKKNNSYLKLLTNIKPTDIFPGIKEFFNELKANQIKIVLASASKNAPIIIRSLEIEDYFDYIVHPDEVKKGKPAPDIFLRGADAVRVDSNHCVGIEDAIAGIEAIKRAGMFAVGVGTQMEMRKAGANWIIQSTKELKLSALVSEYNKVVG